MLVDTDTHIKPTALSGPQRCSVNIRLMTINASFHRITIFCEAFENWNQRSREKFRSKIKLL